MSRRQWIVSVAAFVVLIYAAQHVDWRGASLVMGKASLPPLIVAVSLNALSVALRGVRWWIFLRGVGAPSLALAIRGTVVGAGLNNVVLANGGDAARAILVARAANVSRRATFATLGLDRLFDPVCFALLLIVATFTIRLPVLLTHARGLAATCLISLGVVLGVLFAMSRRGLPNDRSESWRGRVRALSTPTRLLPAFAISLGVWTMQIATFALVARATSIALPLAGSVAAMLLADMGLLLRATPGNVGFFQFAYQIAAQQYGVPNDAANATALLLQIIQAVPITVAALMLTPGIMKSRGFLDARDDRSYRGTTPARHGQITAA
jgi:uncharacterized membrane protein YbhN (UPF0104 family)